MANPLIVNRRPTQGDSDVGALTPFRFGVRDLDTRAVLSSVYSLVVYGKALYRPENEEIPSNDAVLGNNGTSVVFSTFDDAAGTTEPGNPCDQTIEDLGGTKAYRIEKSDGDGVAQEGVLFLTVDAQAGERPYSLRAQMDLTNVNTGTFAYVTFAGFTGVLLGLAYWPENTGLFVFFVDDGVKKVVVAGPAEDGVGTRSVSETTVFDWSAEAYTYSVVWDPSVYRRKAMVFATDSVGDETLLAEVDMDTLPEFLSSVRMGELYAEDLPISQVTFVAGADFPDMGDHIDIFSLDIFDFGRVLSVSGGPTGASTVSTHPTESLFVYGPSGAGEWFLEGDGTAEETTTALKITSDGTGGSYYTREEPDLSSGEWLIMGRVAAENAVHPGEYTTGMGVSVADGTREFRLVLLDDFSRNFMGIVETDATDDDVAGGYKVPGTDVDWEVAFDFVMLGSTSRNLLKLFLNSDTAVAVEHTYNASGYPSALTSWVRFGFIETGTFDGSFFLVHLWVLPNCVFFEASDGTFPDAQGWARVASGGTRAVGDDELELDCTAAGAYDIYYISDATYDATSGAGVVFRTAVASWTDDEGASSPVRVEFGPIAAVRTTTVAAQVFFVQDADGTSYVYLSRETSDLADVLAQNADGKAISATIDLGTAHVFFLDVKPFKYVRLYVDHAPVPAIDVPWSAAGTVLRSLPTNMPAGAVVAVGSLGEDTGVEITFDFFRATTGRGYDLTTGLLITEDELQSGMYGASAELMVDVQDED